MTDIGKTFEELNNEYLDQVAEGKALGELLALRRILRVLLEQRFNQLPDEIVERIDRAETDRLQAAIEGVLTLASLDYLQL